MFFFFFIFGESSFMLAVEKVVLRIFFVLSQQLICFQRSSVISIVIFLIFLLDLKVSWYISLVYKQFLFGSIRTLFHNYFVYKSYLIFSFNTALLKDYWLDDKRNIFGIYWRHQQMEYSGDIPQGLTRPIFIALFKKVY